MDIIKEELFPQRLKALREEKRMTLEQVANKVNSNKVTLSRYERGERSPNVGMVAKLANYFDVDISWLIGETDEKNIKLSINDIYSQLEPPRQTKVYNFAETQLNEQNNVIEFPDRAKELIRGRRMAGGSALHVDDTDARKEVVSSALIPKGADELVEVVGKSMEPLIKDGEEVYIRYQPTVENGEIAVVRIENEGVTCKRVYVEENSIRLKAENPDYEDMYYDAGQVTILGKVLL